MERVSNTGVLVEHLFRREAGRLTAHLARLLGAARLDLAEECVQETMLRALQSWPFQGVPENATAWLFRVAHNVAIDRVRSERRAGPELPDMTDSQYGEPPVEQVQDDELRLLFLCAHPELSRELSVTLSLRLAGGLSVSEIARALLADERAIAQRLVRAKDLIRKRNLSMSFPPALQLAQRLDCVLETIYLIFNEGYAAHAGEALVRHELCRESLRLACLLAASPLASPKVHALTALIALQSARLPARIDDCGEMIVLAEQDRRLWDAHLLALGFHHFDRSIEGEEVSPYHVQAAIAATHARDLQPEVRWPFIMELYDQLLALQPTPIVALNRAVAMSHVSGAEAALAATMVIADAPSMERYHLLLATQGHFLTQLERYEEAETCFAAAAQSPCSEPERRFLQKKLEELRRSRTPVAS